MIREIVIVWFYLLVFIFSSFDELLLTLVFCFPRLNETAPDGFSVVHSLLMMMAIELLNPNILYFVWIFFSFFFFSFRCSRCSSNFFSFYSPVYCNYLETYIIRSHRRTSTPLPQKHVKNLVCNSFSWWANKLYFFSNLLCFLSFWVGEKETESENTDDWKEIERFSSIIKIKMEFQTKTIRCPQKQRRINFGMWAKGFHLQTNEKEEERWRETFEMNAWRRWIASLRIRF